EKRAEFSPRKPMAFNNTPVATGNRDLEYVLGQIHTNGCSMHGLNSFWRSVTLRKGRQLGTSLPRRKQEESITSILPDRGHRLKMCANYGTSSSRHNSPWEVVDWGCSN